MHVILRINLLKLKYVNIFTRVHMRPTRARAQSSRILSIAGECALGSVRPYSGPFIALAIGSLLGVYVDTMCRLAGEIERNYVREFIRCSARYRRRDRTDVSASARFPCSIWPSRRADKPASACSTPATRSSRSSVMPSPSPLPVACC